MPGFDVDAAGKSIMFANNVDFTGTSATGGTAQVSANGQLLIGASTDPKIRVNTLATSNNYQKINNGAGSIALGAVTEAVWIVDGTNPINGTHSTIAAATASAASGDTIFIRPGTYTESFTAKAGVNYIGWSGDGLNNNVIINGNSPTISISSAGNYSFSNIQLKSAGNAMIVSGSGAVTLTLTNFNLVNVSGTTPFGIQLATTSTSTVLNAYNCVFSTGNASTGQLLKIAGQNTANLYGCSFLNPGANASANVIDLSGASATLNMYNCFCQVAIATDFSSSHTGMIVNIDNSVIDTSASNVTSVALVASSNATANIFNTRLASGTATPITIASGSTATLSNIVLNSSNTAAISGGGTVNIGEISQIGTYGSTSISTTNYSYVNIGLSSNGALRSLSTSGTFTAASGMSYFLSGASTITMPASPLGGDLIGFICDTASNVVLTGNTGQKIRIRPNISTTAGTQTAAALGNATIVRWRNNDSTWLAESFIGTWTAA